MKWPFSFGAKSRALKASAAANEAIADFMLRRSFESAQMLREVANWRWDGGFSNTEVLSALPTIRARSRDMAKNSPLYARFIQLMRENIVGGGFRFKSLPFSDPADPTAIDERAASHLEYHWWRWAANPGYADVGRRQNLTQILALAVENWTRDGEAFIVMDEAAPNRYGFALRLVRADCIDETINFPERDGRITRGGVEFDAATNAPTAYWFDGRRADGDAMLWRGRPRVRVEAKHVIHLFERHDADQVRGIPLGYAALVPLKMLDEYTKAELVAARHEACTVGVFHSPLPANAGGVGSPSPEQKDESRRMIRNGQEMWLPSGWTYDSHTPNHPNRGWVDYSTGLQRMISTGLGVDFTELTGNAGGGISVSVRQAILRTREMYRTRQNLVSSLVLDRLFHSWLRSFLSLRVSGPYILKDYERLCDHEFTGRRWGWVDPSAEMNAATTAVAHGWRSDAEVAADYGNDIDDNIKEAMRIKDAKKAAGLITVGNGNASQPKGVGGAQSPATDGDDKPEPADDEESDYSQAALEKLYREMMGKDKGLGGAGHPSKTGLQPAGANSPCLSPNIIPQSAPIAQGET